MRTTSKIENNSVELIGSDTPLRLEAAVRIAFPAGGITIAGLRKEVARGNLAVEKIAGKLFTTLDDIKRMRDKCRVKKQRQTSLNDLRREDVQPPWSSETDRTPSAHESLERHVKSALRKKLMSS